MFHQAQATEAKKYAKEKYGAEVFVFDGKSDGTVMTQNVDQIAAQGMDAASLHIWDYEAVKPAVQEDLGKGIILTSFFSPLGDSGIPIARSDEKGISFAMGAEMATQWKAANPDKPIVMVELGWPNHTEVKSGRTDPFVAGVLSVDPTAKDLGCQDASKGPDAAKQIITDLMTTHPEVNLIYSEASNLTVGTMAALTPGRPRQVRQWQTVDRDRRQRRLRRSRDETRLRSEQLAEAVHGPAPSRDCPWPHRPDHGCRERQSADRPRSLPRSSSTRPTTSPSGRCRAPMPRSG